MGRYSPTVIPQVPDPLDVVNRMWAGYLGHRQDQRAEQGLELEERGLDIREKEAEARLGSEKLTRYRQGFREGRAPMEVAEESLPTGLRRGASVLGEKPPAIGLQPGQRQGIPAMRDRLQEERQKFEPEWVAKPGALIPGTGQFAPRAISTEELQAPQMVTKPGYEQVTEDTYFDPTGTPEARMLDRQVRYDEARTRLQATMEEQERARIREAAIGGGYTPQQAEMLAEGVPLSPPRQQGALTMSQAYDVAYGNHQTWDGEKWVSDGTPNDEIWEEATWLYNNPGNPDNPFLGGEPRTVSPFGPPMDFSSYIDQYRDPFGARGGDPVEATPSPPLTHAEILEAQEYVEAWDDPEEQEKVLASLGYTQRDIDQILGR